MTEKKLLGLVTGLNPRAALAVKTALLAQGGENVCVIESEGQFKIDPDPVFALSDRKIFVFNEAGDLMQRGADLVLVPDFKAGSFINEIQREYTTPVLDMKTALMAMMKPGMVVGVLDEGNTRGCADGACELSQQIKMIFPTEAEKAQLDSIREVIRKEGPTDAAAAAIETICRRMVDAGATVIVPNCTQFALTQPALAFR